MAFPQSTDQLLTANYIKNTAMLKEIEDSNKCMSGLMGLQDELLLEQQIKLDLSQEQQSSAEASTELLLNLADLQSDMSLEQQVEIDNLHEQQDEVEISSEFTANLATLQQNTATEKLAESEHAISFLSSAIEQLAPSSQLSKNKLTMFGGSMKEAARGSQSEEVHTNSAQLG